MGTFPAFLAAWGPVDMGFGSGQGVKCYHSEHLYGELWHRAFIVAADTPSCNYLISCGSNIEASGGVVGVWRHANARVRGMKRVQVEPHLSVTGACSAQWVPIKPKTDPAFLFALIHVMLHEVPRERLDLPFLAQRTGSPYLVGPNGYYLRDRATRKPLVWDEPPAARAARHPRHPRGAGGHVQVDAVESAPTTSAGRRPAAPPRPPSTSWWRTCASRIRPSGRRASATCPRPPCAASPTNTSSTPAWARRSTIDGKTLPFRPVAVTLGKTVNNGWGGYECCWARTCWPALVGALEVPGGTSAPRCGWSADGRAPRQRAPGRRRVHGLPDEPDRQGDLVGPAQHPQRLQDDGAADGQRRLGAGAGADALLVDVPRRHAQGPAQGEPPDVWFVYRTNPAISFWDTGAGRQDRALPVHRGLCLHARRDQPLRRRAAARRHRPGRPAAAAHRRHQVRRAVLGARGLRAAPAGGAPRGQARDFTDIATELARRCGLLEKYNAAINRGAGGVKL
jgi:phenylacetyl-CoA:acceptor oxidoreductase